MSKPKKKEYWLERVGDVYSIYSGPKISPDICATFSAREWNANMTFDKHCFLRLRNKTRTRIRICDLRYGGFSVCAIGEPEKIGD